MVLAAAIVENPRRKLESNPLRSSDVSQATAKVEILICRLPPWAAMGGRILARETAFFVVPP
jgi:hypothetical protein